MAKNSAWAILLRVVKRSDDQIKVYIRYATADRSLMLNIKGTDGDVGSAEYGRVWK